MMKELICKIRGHNKIYIPDEIVEFMGFQGSVCLRCQFVVRYYN